MRGRVGAGPLVHHLPLVENDQVLGLQGHRYLMQHADHGAALGDQGLHAFEPVGLVRRVEVGQGFVHQQHAGLHGQGARQQHALALPARETAHAAHAPVPALGLAQRLLHSGMVCLAGRRQPALVRQAAQHDHVLDPHVAGHGLVLAQPGERAGPFARTPLPQRAAQELHLALHARAGFHACKGAQQRGFACAIGADDGGPAAGGQGQAQAAQDLSIAQANLQGARLQGGGQCRHAPSPPRRAWRRCTSHSR